MKNNLFIINGYGQSALGDMWFTGHIRYTFSDNTFIETEECEIYFEDFFQCSKWIKEMNDNIVFPKEVKKGWAKRNEISIN